MIQKFDIENFLKQAEGHPILDVRAPAEYHHGHITGSLNLPLFSDHERAVIGTLYKQAGREAAMMKGLEFYGANMQQLITDLKKHTTGRTLFVHCWRGGMRSGVVSWMLDLFGYQVAVAERGYKSFRRAALDSFGQQKRILILGGKTGSAKTDLIREMIRLHHQAIDLEGLAHHKGSAFGGLGQPAAPTQEQFENDLYMMFRKTDARQAVWLEDESQRVGLVNIPNPLWTQMRNARIIYLEIPFEIRLQYILKNYGQFETQALKEATMRIRKRLGGMETQNVLNHLDAGDVVSAFTILLSYYDRAYLHATRQRNPESVFQIKSETTDTGINAQLILEAMRSFS